MILQIDNSEWLTYLDLVSISSTFFAQIFCTKVLQAAFLWLCFGFVTKEEKLLKALSYEKLSSKMLMKLTPTYSFQV